MNCHRCLVIHVLTNVRIFGVYRKVSLSSINQKLCDNVFLRLCVLRAQEKQVTPLQKLFCRQCRQPVAVVAVASAVYGASPLYNTACTLNCLGQRQCGQSVSALWVRFAAESCVGGCYSTVTALFCLAENRRHLVILEIGGKGDCNN